MITAAAICRTNAELITNYVKPLYLNDDQIIMDVTFGRGRWWTKWTPPKLVAHDLYTLDEVDFCNLPEADESVDVVAFDPPYVATGGFLTSSMKDFQERYGINIPRRTPEDVRQNIAVGMLEARRVLKPGGLLMVKCGNYVSGGKHIPGVNHTINDAATINYDLVTQFIHVSGTGAQPTQNLDGSPRRVLSPRSNYSVLLILRK